MPISLDKLAVLHASLPLATESVADYVICPGSEARLVPMRLVSGWDERGTGAPDWSDF